jgi:hypothetical protein
MTYSRLSPLNTRRHLNVTYAASGLGGLALTAGGQALFAPIREALDRSADGVLLVGRTAKAPSCLRVGAYSRRSLMPRWRRLPASRSATGL